MSLTATASGGVRFFAFEVRNQAGGFDQALLAALASLLVRWHTGRSLSKQAAKDLRNIGSGGGCVAGAGP